MSENNKNFLLTALIVNEMFLCFLRTFFSIKTNNDNLRYKIRRMSKVK
jgi:hypothetical protein